MPRRLQHQLDMLARDRDIRVELARRQPLPDHVHQLLVAAQIDLEPLGSIAHRLLPWRALAEHSVPAPPTLLPALLILQVANGM
jgi:hypothetical protein